MATTKKAIKRSVRRADPKVRRRATDDLLDDAGIHVRRFSDLAVIGITVATAGPGEDSLDADACRLAALIQSLGGVPLLLPPVTSMQAIRRQAELIDGLVLPPGPPMHPNFIAQTPKRAQGSDPMKDRYEWQMFDRALEADLPVLGIGRGFSLMNLFMGGAPGGPMGIDGKIKVVPLTRLARAIEMSTFDAASRESDGIARLGKSLIASAHGPARAVQAAEVVDRVFVMGVRFDVGLSEDDVVGRRVIEALLRAAKAGARSS
jgi:putative glutamine amidotransferase